MRQHLQPPWHATMHLLYFVLRRNSSTKHSIPQLAVAIQKSSQRYEACLSRIENKMEMKAVAKQLVAAHDD